MFTELQVHHRSAKSHVVIGSGIFQQAAERIIASSVGGKAGRCAVISDSNVGKLYLEPLISALDGAGLRPLPVVVRAGEGSKSLSEVACVIDQLVDARLDRHSFIVALGGGVIGDLAGFVAAIYYRGIPYVQIPTTVISQCDSAIGGKTGVNTVSGKNLVGAFHPAALVLVDPEVLCSLPEREFNEGFAEVIKHGAIRDPELFGLLASPLAHDQLPEVIARNLAIKAEIVNADEFEMNGQRATLNFGHTIGHGIEQAAGYGRFLHGEAISLGLVAASRISARKAGLPAADVDAITQRLKLYGLPIVLPPEISTDAVLESLALDKKFQEGRIRFVLLPAIGQAFLSKPGEVTIEDLRFAIEELRSEES